MGKRRLIRPDRGVAVSTLKRMVTNAYQNGRSDHGVKLSVNIHNYTSRTQVLNAAVEGHEFTKEALELLNKRCCSGHFKNNKGEAIKFESVQKHLSGMNTQGKTVHIRNVDGTTRSFGKGSFKSDAYKSVSYKSIITIDGGWVARLK